VDGVSSVASIPVRTDAWGLDVVATASQKGWMLPPGLAFVSLSQRAWKAHAAAKMPRYYFDASAYKKYFEIGQPPYTPGVSLYFALDLALKQLLAEGLPSVYARHGRIAQMTRDGVKAMGLSLFPEERAASETVTAVKVPEGVDAAKVVEALRVQHRVVIAGGQEKLKGKIFRIGHMGRVSPAEIQQTLTALGAALPKAVAARA
jgi:aspartate aminotransferase-like enzyme